jgi:hypothetical protein
MLSRRQATRFIWKTQVSGLKSQVSSLRSQVWEYQSRQSSAVRKGGLLPPELHSIQFEPLGRSGQGLRISVNSLLLGLLITCFDTPQGLS